jgi:predicted nucleotidyltransferase
MTEQLKALQEINAFLRKEKVKYMIIGGIALQYWGEPRFTRDVDITVMAGSNEESIFIKRILAVFKPRIKDAESFAFKNRVILIFSSNGIEIDISLGIPGYESESIKRVKRIKIENNFFPIVSAEDLIIHKMVASRARDVEDIKGILIRQREKLDVRYIRHWLKIFADILGKKEIIDTFDVLYKFSKTK